MGSLRIWETDPDAKPRPRNRFAEDVVGFIHGGMVIKNKPMPLSEWRFTSDDPTVIDRIAHLYGGDPEEWETEKTNNLQVLTTTSAIGLALDDPACLSARMVLWGRKSIIHACDGVYFLDGEDRGQPCGCPSEFAARKAAAEKGTGPQPEITLKARLIDDEHLGYFVYRTSAWTLTRELADVENQIADAAEGNARIRVNLRLEHVQYTTKKGQPVEFDRPVLADIAPMPDLKSDEPAAA